MIVLHGQAPDINCEKASGDSGLINVVLNECFSKMKDCSKCEHNLNSEIRILKIKLNEICK
jgi:hypothetical protein